MRSGHSQHELFIEPSPQTEELQLQLDERCRRLCGGLLDDTLLTETLTTCVHRECSCIIMQHPRKAETQESTIALERVLEFLLQVPDKELQAVFLRLADRIRGTNPPCWEPYFSDN